MRAPTPVRVIRVSKVFTAPHPPQCGEGRGGRIVASSVPCWQVTKWPWATSSPRLQPARRCTARGFPATRQQMQEGSEALSAHSAILTLTLQPTSLLSFLDTLVYTQGVGSQGNKVYCKPTHTELYLNAASSPYRPKPHSASTLVPWAMVISGERNLDQELQLLSKVCDKI